MRYGAVELVVDARADPLLVDVARPGSFVGELAVLNGAAHIRTAAARHPTAALSVSRETASALGGIYPRICTRWLRLAAHRLWRMQRRLIEVTAKSALARVGQSLLDEVEDGARSSSTRRRSQLAAALGLSRQTVSRSLRELERHGSVVRRRGEVEVLDPDRLRELMPGLIDYRPSA